MASTLVLASLTIDASGVVSGVAEIDGALDQGEQAVDKFAKGTKKSGSAVQGFVGRLFNLRGALNAVARSFGLVGIILAVSAAIRKLSLDVLNTVSAWGRLKTKLEDVYNSFIKGETLTERLTRKIQGLSKAAGFSSSLEDIEKAKSIQLAINAIKESLSGAAPGSALFKSLSEDLERANDKMRETQQRLFDLNLTMKDIQNLAGTIGGDTGLFGMVRGLFGFGQSGDQLQQAVEPVAPKAGAGLDFFKIMGIPTKTEVEARIAELMQALEFLSKEGRPSELNLPGEVSIGLYVQAIDNLKNKLLDLGVPLQDIEETLSRLNLQFVEGVPKVGDFKKSMEDLAESMSFGKAMFDLFQTGILTLAQSIADAFLESGVTARQAVANLLKTIARLAITYAILFTAAGVAASTGFGAVAMGGTPAQFFKAAAIFAAVGIAAGIGAKALSKGDEGGGDIGPRGQGGPTQPVTRRGTPTVNVVIEGSIIGTDPNELARSISDLIGTAQSDGNR